MMNKIIIVKAFIIYPVVLFIILTSLLTFPLILKINSSIPGSDTTDEPYAALWNFWWLEYSWQNSLPEHKPLIAMPWGIDNYKSGQPLWNSFNKWFSVLTNNIFTYNLEALFGFFLSALFMYYLALYVTENAAASFLSAIIYAFCPYHFARAWQHLGLSMTQWMPLYILAILKLKNNPNIKYGILSAAAYFLVFSFDLYYAYFMFIVSIVFILFLFIHRWKAKLKDAGYFKNDFRVIKMMFFSGILAFLFAMPVICNIFQDRLNYSGKAPAVYNSFKRPFEDLFSQSARPLSYFLPATAHPIFGKFTEHFVGSFLYGESLTEHTVYLGWVPILLAFVAFRRWRKGKKLSVVSCQLSDKREDFYISFFVVLTIAAWLSSQPPWWNILGFKLYMPSFFMYKIAPMFRAYCRFGIVVMLGIAVLAGYGFKFILEKFKNKIAKVGIAMFFSSLILFEFWNYPPFRVIDVSKAPIVYYWLGQQSGDFVIAEYPLDINGANELFRFYQTKHKKKIINCTTPGTFANRVARKIVKLSDLDTAQALSSIDVKYVLVHKGDYLNTELAKDREELNMIPQNQGLKFIRSFPSEECPKDVMCVQETGPIDVYEVTAAPLEPKVVN